ncbi:MAG: alpha/beta fold hydrolase [Candidatus Hydrogenedentes bacterium]|nr:alpha/beta fold hydrolase [Candidatus Hydrogenedentota bacterium]
MNKYTHLIAVFCIALAVSCSPERAVNAPRDVSFQTADGYTIHGTLYPVTDARPAGLILVPMLGATRDTWQRFALRAQAQGYMSIAIDLRGHGESTNRNGQESSYRAFTAKDWAGATADIAGAKRALLDAGANPEDLAIAGASIGANLALRYARDDAQLQAVVMLSPGLNYQGVATESSMREIGNRPVLLMTGIDDAYSADTCRTLKPLAQGHCEVREYDGAAHGTDLLDAHAMCGEQILLWLSAIIGEN